MEVLTQGSGTNAGALKVMFDSEAPSMRCVLISCALHMLCFKSLLAVVHN